MKFIKMQGTGNDFIVIETDNQQHNWQQLAVAICDRHFGVGADGLLLLLPSNVADFRMRIFNADGSEAETCGNGIRCLVKYFIEKRVADIKIREILLETAAGVRRAEFERVGDKVSKVELGMGKPEFETGSIPVTISDGEGNLISIKSMSVYSMIVAGRKLPLAFISMGNPHAVYFSSRPVCNFPLSRIGPEVEHHKVFPEGVNFEVVRVLNRHQIEARVWERGVGETLSCGSGACAVAVAARLYGYVGEEVQLKLPGGSLEIYWDGAGEVFLSGPVETVFSGEYSDGDG